MAGCIQCGGSDEHPAQHCQDCPLLEHITDPHRRGKGCKKCGFTGFASGPVYDRTLGQRCPECEHKVLRVMTEGVILKRAHGLFELQVPMDLGRVVAFGQYDAVHAAARLICGKNWRHADMYEQLYEQVFGKWTRKS